MAIKAKEYIDVAIFLHSHVELKFVSLISWYFW